jgi:hypothetical protein
MLILTALLVASTVTYAGEKSEMQIAQELIYGKWVIPKSSWIKYVSSENSIEF